MSELTDNAARKGRGWRVLARIAVVLLVYAMSIGPACAIFSGAVAHIPFYNPVFFVARIHPAVSRPLAWYLNACSKRGWPLDPDDFRAVGQPLL
jgi:hypothetical protein